MIQITQRNKFSVGEQIEIMKPDGENRLVTVLAIYDEEGNSVESAPHPQQKLFVDLGGGADVYDILRRQRIKNVCFPRHLYKGKSVRSLCRAFFSIRET